MKTKILSMTLLSLWSITSVFAQDRTTVTATNSDISDNLDLRAVASIFGDSANLNDFERRLNDPKAQISNLDLNGDNQVDYLRVIESVEGNTHLIIIQSVLGRDTFQDIATVEVERDRHNRVQVQVVGDVYMYGDNYIYEPVYAYTPVIYTSFWVSNYRPYCSSWYWGYYPSFYVAWSPFPVYTYHNHIGIYINHNHYYNYVNYRRCGVAYNNYYNGRRGNAYERQYPNRSFSNRNSGYANRYEMDNNRTNTRNSTGNGTRFNNDNNGTRNNSVGMSSPRPTRVFNGSNEIKSESSPRGNINTRSSESPRSVTIQNGSRDTEISSNPRSYTNPRATESPRTYGNSGSSESPRSIGTQGNTRGFETTRAEVNRNEQRNDSQRNSSPRQFSEQRGNSQRTEGGSRGSRR